MSGGRFAHIRMIPDWYLDFAPIDVQRIGLGWMGWLPFKLTKEDVPEAEIVHEMHEGTLVVSQMKAPEYGDERAIERMQDVEIRLNLLDVLPSGPDMRAGNWPPKI